MNTSDNRQKGRPETPGSAHPLDEPVQIARVAALVAQRRERQSLRALADEIGVSKSTVDALVQAHNRLRPMLQPHVTWPKLRVWYLRERLVEAGNLQEPVDMALVTHELLAAVPEADRRAATADLIGFIARIHDHYGGVRPTWLNRLSHAVAEAASPGSPPLPPEPTPRSPRPRP